MVLDSEVFKNEEAPAAAMLAVFLRVFGMEAMDWEPELIRKEVEERYDMKLSDLQSDKLNAAITVLKTDAFENNWQVFETCCHLFNNQPDELESFDPLDAEELVVGLCEAILIKHERIVFGDHVKAYAGLVFYDYGFSKAPKLFSDAIMPEQVVASDDSEKNDALDELFNAHLEYLVDWFGRISK